MKPINPIIMDTVIIIMAINLLTLPRSFLKSPFIQSHYTTIRLKSKLI